MLDHCKLAANLVTLTLSDRCVKGDADRCSSGSSPLHQEAHVTISLRERFSFSVKMVKLLLMKELVLVFLSYSMNTTNSSKFGG